MKQRVKKYNEWVESLERTQQDVIQEMFRLWEKNIEAQEDPYIFLFALNKNDYNLIKEEGCEFYKSIIIHPILIGESPIKLTRRDTIFYVADVAAVPARKCDSTKTIIIPGTSNNSLF